MGNEVMNEEEADVRRPGRSRGAVKTRKEKKAGVVMREAEQRTQSSLKSMAENEDPNQT